MKSIIFTLFALARLAASQEIPLNKTVSGLIIDDISDLNERDWFPLSTGLMMERSHTPEEGHSITKRASAARTAGQPIARDIGQSPISLPINDQGLLVMPSNDLSPDSLAERSEIRVIRALRTTLRRRAKNKRQKKTSKLTKKARSNKKARASLKELQDVTEGVKRTFSSVITWYTGHDLLGPSCVQKSKWAPTDESMIAAVTLDWDSKPACGTWLRLRAKGGKKAIVVRIVDACAGCKAQSAHVDLTKAAFRALYDLDVGLVNDIQAQIIANPVTDWTEAVIAIYGPKDL